jgi:hypothetical protein
VDLEQQVGERLDRRSQGQVDRRKPTVERGDVAAVPAHSKSEIRNPKSETGELRLIFRISDFMFRISEPATEDEPAAQIDAGRQQ